jgi:hypothetical protein
MGKKTHIFTIMTVLLQIISPEAVHAREMEKCSMHMEAVDQAFFVTGDIGEQVSFSDIGCAVVMRKEMCAMELLSFDNSAVVQDFASGREILMSTAYFVVGAGVTTPLVTDIVPFAAEETAKRFVKEWGAGKILRYNDLMLMEVTFGKATKD